MAKIIVEFKKDLSMKFSLNVVVDNEMTIRLANGESTEVELSEGSHEIDAFIPYRGNGIYMVSEIVNIKLDKDYKIEYYVSPFALNGALKIMEAPAKTSFEDISKMLKEKNASVTRTNFKINYIKILTTFMVAVLLIFGVNFYLEKLDEHNTYKNKERAFAEEMLAEVFEYEQESIEEKITITELNAPKELRGMRATALEVKIVTQRRHKEVNLKFKIENISYKSTLPMVLWRDSFGGISYVDKIAKQGYYIDQNIYGDLSEGKSIEREYAVPITNESKTLELVFPLNENGQKTVSFILDIPEMSE